MATADEFETWVRASLAHYGLQADDVDLAVMRVAEQVYGPQRDALMAADLSGVAPEQALDPSRSPFAEDRR
jgi:hypothetical protein